MARKKHAEEHVNLERWLVSYADFITLLFATFVVLYALSQLDIAKFKDLKISLAKAFSSPPTILKGDAGVLDKKGNQMTDSGGQMENQNLIPPLLDQPMANKEKADFDEAVDNINKKQSDAFSDVQGVKAEVTDRGLVISLVGNIVFDPASAAIKKESYKIIDSVGDVIKSKFVHHLIRVEGHTDNLAIQSAIFPSNWELSSARAASIIRYLITKSSLPANRFSAVGYADSRPLASNATEKGRKTNRRVEIVVLKNKLLNSETLSDDFKKDFKSEISKFMFVGKTTKSANMPQSSDAVENLLKEDRRKGLSKGNVIIFKSSDNYEENSQELLNKLKEQERREEIESKNRREAFFSSVRKSFKENNH